MDDERALRDHFEAGGTRRLRPIDTVLAHRRQCVWLRRKLAEPFDELTAVVTHHAPHCKSLARLYAQDWSSGGFVSELPEWFFKLPQLGEHGHTHDSFDYEVGHCRVVCNPRGCVNWHGEDESR